MDGVGGVCESFIEITNSKELDLRPLQVNRPIPVSQVCNKIRVFKFKKDSKPFFQIQENQYNNY